MAFLYINNELSERESKKNNPIYYSNKKIKYLGINLTKEVIGLYSKHYRILRKKLRKIQINGSIYHVQGLEELTLKCPYYPKQSIESMQFS